jgi:hypothetical protein
MKKLFLIAMIFAVTGFTGYGQDKNAEIKKLLNLMSSGKMMEQTMGNMINAMQQQAAGKMQNGEAKEKSEKILSYLTEEATAMINKMVNEDMVDLYAKHFTEAEIKDFIVFYESPSGKKLLAATPALTGELMGIMMQKHLPAFQEKIKAKMEE